MNSISFLTNQPEPYVSKYDLVCYIRKDYYVTQSKTTIESSFCTEPVEDKILYSGSWHDGYNNCLVLGCSGNCDYFEAIIPSGTRYYVDLELKFIFPEKYYTTTNKVETNRTVDPHILYDIIYRSNRQENQINVGDYFIYEGNNMYKIYPPKVDIIKPSNDLRPTYATRRVGIIVGFNDYHDPLIYSELHATGLKLNFVRDRNYSHLVGSYNHNKYSSLYLPNKRDLMTFFGNYPLLLAINQIYKIKINLLDLREGHGEYLISDDNGYRRTSILKICGGHIDKETYYRYGLIGEGDFEYHCDRYNAVLFEYCPNRYLLN